MDNEYPKSLYIGDLGESLVVNSAEEEAAALAQGYHDTLQAAAVAAHEPPQG